MAHYGPPDASLAPRYTGVRTFARCPNVTDFAAADVAVLGVPFDTATSYRTGARFGPAAIREQSQLLRPWHPAHAIDVFAALSVVDGGDLAVTPGNAERTAAQIAEGLAPVVAAGAVPIVLGGDHSIVLGELRAHAEHHGPVALVLLDAHADTWDAYYRERFFHGTPASARRNPMASCGSSPPTSGVPVPGANAGSSTSMSNERYAGPSPTRSRTRAP